MKTPKKVIEKISLPLMFVTFVMAVLMFAVSPVSAAPNRCGVFCDQDNDGYFKDHKRCPADCDGNEGIDCDDSNDQIPEHEACPGVVSEGSITYTAQLTGAFVFGPDPIVAVYPNSKESALLDDTPDTPLYMSIQLSDNLATTWDNLFNTCPVLLATDSVNDFFSYDWYISKYGGVRVMFRDFLLPYDHKDGPVVDGAVITVQLIGDYFDSDVENFLPVPVPDPNGPDTAFRIFNLTKFVIWGNTAHGVPGPRRACQLPGGGGADTNWLTPTPSTLVITATRDIP